MKILKENLERPCFQANIFPIANFFALVSLDFPIKFFGPISFPVNHCS